MHSGLGELIDANFDLRRSICRIPAGQAEMVDRARRAGATAKFAGSGGAADFADPANWEYASGVATLEGMPVGAGQIAQVGAA